MSRTITLVLLSGSTENDDAAFAVNLSKALLEKGGKVNLFLYGNGCNLANKPVPVEGRSAISDALRAHMDGYVLSEKIEELTRLGAKIATCHTTEYSRGTEGCPYLDSVERGDVGNSYTRFLMATDVLLAIGN
ncbi:DsrE family protein [Desulfovibrio aminophilus]|uniref:DsrE family protein n=1 Tax=Desulfovibrio aminophilus TaxID=81425 RepID=UPI00339A1466